MTHAEQTIEVARQLAVLSVPDDAQMKLASYLGLGRPGDTTLAFSCECSFDGDASVTIFSRKRLNHFVVGPALGLEASLIPPTSEGVALFEFKTEQDHDLRSALIFQIKRGEYRLLPLLDDEVRIIKRSI